MSKQTKILVLVLFIVVVLAIGSQKFIKKEANVSSPNNESGVSFNSKDILQPTSTPTPTVSPITQTVIIDFGDGNKVSDKIFAQTAYDAIVKLAKAKNIPIETKEYKFGILVTKVGDKANSNDKSWIYFVNGKVAPVASDRFTVVAGDKVEWKYQKPQ